MLNQIEKIIKNCAKKFIDKKRPREEQFKLHSINLICFTIIFLALIAVCINIYNQELIRIFSSSFFVFSFSIPVVFNFYGKRILARVALLFASVLSISIHSLLYGGGMDLEFVLLLAPVAALLLTDNKVLFRVCLIVSYTFFAAIKILPNYYEPYYPNADSLFIKLIVGAGILALIILILRRFKAETLFAQKKTEQTLSKLQQVHQALALSEARYKAVFENAFDGILLINLETHKVVSCNKKIVDFLGISEQQIKQANIRDYLTKQGSFNLEQNIEKAKKYGSTKEKVHIKSVNGQEIFAEVSGVVLPDSDNKLAVAIFKDVTAETRAKEKLVRVNSELRNFAHAASHDMKEPLRMIQSFGQLLNKRNQDNLSTESQEFLGYIINASRRMTQLVNDLLEYSTTGTEKNEHRPTNLNNVLTLVKNNLRLKIFETETQIFSFDLPTVQGNNTQLIQVFQNIIANAIKFQKPDVQPKIEITSNILENKNLICIKDNGIGIAEEYHEQVFGVFKRLHSKQDYEGSGIGLATCKKIIEKMGGKIWVESKLGEGTSFFFTLPILMQEYSDKRFVGKKTPKKPIAASLEF